MTDTTLEKRPVNNNQRNNRSDALKIFESKVFWVALVLILFSMPLIFSFRKKPIEEFPVYAQLNEFHLINQRGQEVSSKNFAGSVLLVSFVFTRCPDFCPLMTQQMAKVQRRLKGAAKSVQLLSISVDPEFDRPEVLKRYAEKYSADQTIWTFATGNLADIQTLVVDGFKQALDTGVNETPQADDSVDKMEQMMDITHSENFVLVDQVGQIRGFRHLQSDEDINRIVRDLAILVNTTPPQKNKAVTEEEKAVAR